jgi:hypothetical protein
MWSLTSQRSGRTSGAKKSRSSTRKDFFNNIRHKRSFLKVSIWPVTRSGAASGMRRNAPARWRSIRTTPRSSGSSSTIKYDRWNWRSSNQTWRPSSNREPRQREIASRKVLLLYLTRLRRYVAAVTGGMGGIGQGIVIALTQRDFDVVVCDQTSCVTKRRV